MHLIDVLEQGRVDLIPSYYAPDGSNPPTTTPEQWRDRVLRHHKIGPGFKITILDMIAEGDKVAVLWRGRFHLFGRCPTHRPRSHRIRLANK